MTSAAERDGTDLVDLLTAALQEAGGVAVPDLDGLLDPAGYTGMSGPLVDRALERLEKVRQGVRMNDVPALEFIRARTQSIPPAERRAELLATPGFGDTYSDHMVTVRWSAEQAGTTPPSDRSPRSRCTRPPWHCTTAKRFFSRV